MRAEELVHFADGNLKAAVEARSGIADLTPTNGLTYLHAQHKGIGDLDGIQHATNLANLY